VHHAVLWQAGTNQDIGAGAGDWEISRAFGINDVGQIVGDFAPDAGLLGIHDRRAFLWENGVRQDLGALPGHASGTALDVNQGGQIVGWSGTVDGVVSRAFLWENGVMQDLGALSGDVNSQALSINTSGQVVGWSGTPDRSVSRAFLWQDGEMLDLNGVLVLDLNGVLAPNWVFTEATAINDAGQIVGVGRHNGQTRAFLLKPVLPVLGTGIVPARLSAPF
jgi:probable HAF family extracellular repeat protein